MSGKAASRRSGGDGGGGVQATLLAHLLARQQEAAAGTGRVFAASPPSPSSSLPGAAAVAPHAILGSAAAALLHLSHALDLATPLGRASLVSAHDGGFSAPTIPSGLARWRAGIASAFLLRACLDDALASCTPSTGAAPAAPESPAPGDDGEGGTATSALTVDDVASAPAAGGPDVSVSQDRPLALIQASIAARLGSVASAQMIIDLTGVADDLSSDLSEPPSGRPADGDRWGGPTGLPCDPHLPDLIPYYLDDDGGGGDGGDGLGFASGLEDDGFVLEDELEGPLSGLTR